MWSSDLFYFFFFNDTATTEIYTLSLHDALPISYEVDELTKKYTVFALNCASINVYDFDGDSYVDTYCQEDCIQRNKEYESEKEKEKHESFFKDLELFMDWASTQAEIIEIIRKAYEKTEKNPPKIEYNPKLMNDAYVG